MIYIFIIHHFYIFSTKFFFFVNFVLFFPIFLVIMTKIKSKMEIFPFYVNYGIIKDHETLFLCVQALAHPQAALWFHRPLLPMRQ